ncbi:MAG: M14 family zinc carboxypeptidase [Thermoanaerobaculia bacterium]
MLRKKQGSSWILPALWIAASLTFSLPAAASPPPGEGPWVVRAFFGTPEMIRAVASWADHLGRYPARSMILVEVDSAGYERLEQAGFYVEVDAEKSRLAQLPARARELGIEAVRTIPGFPCYRTVEETYQLAQAMVTAHPTLASIVDMGDSWEKTVNSNNGYDLRVLKLTNSAIPGPKPKLFITSAIHAREYTTAETILRFAQQLVDGYGVNADATWILDYNEVHLLLHTNPDGRKKAEAGISWRKNTHTNACFDPNSIGVDLNRNFDFEWGTRGGSSPDVCDETFRGPSAASEPETQAVESYLTAIFPDQRPDDLVTPSPADATGIYLDVHSFSPDVLTPWGFSPPNCTGGPLAPNVTQLLTLGRKYGFYSGYEVLQGSLYCTDGDTMDYGYGRLGIAALAVELGTSFFESCPSFEQNVVPSNLPALTYLAKVARAPFQLPAGPEAVAPTLNPRPATPGQLVSLTATVNDARYEGSEPTQTVAEAEYYLDVPPWAGGAVAHPLSAADGAFDEVDEAVTGSLDTTSLAVGQHQVFVRGRDSAGNWGAVSAVFLTLIDPVSSPHLTGVVSDAVSGAPLVASVAVGAFGTTTLANGSFDLQLPSGNYSVTVSAPGHALFTTMVTLSDFGTVNVDAPLVPYVAALADDVEGTSVAWTAQAPWARTTEAAYSGTHSWTDSPGGNYGNNRDISLTSPPVDLSFSHGTILSFRHRYDLEASFDFGHVEISTNNGASWTEVALFSGASPVGQWLLAEVPVPALDGVSQARVRFRLTSDTIVTRDGWHVDDINLLTLPSFVVPVFADGFESGNTSAWAAQVP